MADKYQIKLARLTDYLGNSVVTAFVTRGRERVGLYGATSTDELVKGLLKEGIDLIDSVAGAAPSVSRINGFDPASKDFCDMFISTYNYFRAHPDKKKVTLTVDRSRERKTIDPVFRRVWLNQE